ncbi:MAG: FHA domain-containing protein [Anaerolineae bacterium]|nr:FHA domain-containing protein [Anaerolineae bacterium]
MVLPEQTLTLPIAPTVQMGSESIPTAYISGEDSIVLEVDKHQLVVTVPQGQQVIIGRYHATNAEQPQVDLTPFGAMNAGCSRLHAAIGHDEAGWWIKDLNSSNGTWINGERAAPLVAYRLAPVSTVWLTKLDVRIVLPTETLPM